MTTPAPRPALRKAADAHIHPADPSGTHRLRPAAEAADAPAPAPPAEPAPEAPSGPRRLSGPLGGTTSDSLRAAGKRRRPQEKSVELTVKLPKSLRKEFREATKSAKQDPDAVLEALIRAWLDR